MRVQIPNWPHDNRGDRAIWIALFYKDEPLKLAPQRTVWILLQKDDSVGSDRKVTYRTRNPSS